jgi:hypothetical protein
MSMGSKEGVTEKQFSGSCAKVSSPARTAVKAPSCTNFLHLNSWLGCIPYFRATADILIPGCSASATKAFLSSADQRRLRSTDVMTFIVSIRLFFLELVLIIVLLPQLISSWKSVRSKRGLRHGLNGGYVINYINRII